MKLKTYAVVALFAVTWVLSSWHSVSAQDPKPEEPKTEAPKPEAPKPDAAKPDDPAAQAANGEQEAIMKKWMEFMTPGAEHKLLKYKEGRWKLHVEMWVSPDAKPTISEGTSEMKLIMGGRYLMDSTRSTYNGMAFEGMGIVGYDNLKKKFVSIWIDNMGTGISPGEGTYDEATKTYTYTTQAPDVVSGNYKAGRSTERIINDNEWIVETYDTAPDGKEFLTMKGYYTRVK